MSELKPCPFCGGEAKIRHRAFETTSIQCERCGVETLLYEDSPSSSGKSKAKAAWNRRSQPANEPLTPEQMQELLERLEAECREAGDGHEDYTNGYRWGHRNGQIELLRKVLRIGDGVCESDRRPPERSKNE